MRMRELAIAALVAAVGCTEIRYVEVPADQEAKAESRDAGARKARKAKPTTATPLEEPEPVVEPEDVVDEEVEPEFRPEPEPEEVVEPEPVEVVEEPAVEQPIEEPEPVEVEEESSTPCWDAYQAALDEWIACRIDCVERRGEELTQALQNCLYDNCEGGLIRGNAKYNVCVTPDEQEDECSYRASIAVARCYDDGGREDCIGLHSDVYSRCSEREPLDAGSEPSATDVQDAG